MADINLKEAEATAEKSVSPRWRFSSMLPGESQSMEWSAACLSAEVPLTSCVNNAGIFDIAPLLRGHSKKLRQNICRQCERVAFHVAGSGAANGKAGPRWEDRHGVSGWSSRGTIGSEYCASKAAVIGSTVGRVGSDQGKDQRRYSPGVVDTPMWDEVDAMFARYENRPVGEKKRLVGESVPYGRMGTPGLQGIVSGLKRQRMREYANAQRRRWQSDELVHQSLNCSPPGQFPPSAEAPRKGRQGARDVSASPANIAAVGQVDQPP